ncbi:MAG: CDP-diacylglycerol--glycerol-3-phosphate 3-phosphatidyltransferase [Alphaproteobacteria bacterium]
MKDLPNILTFSRIICIPVIVALFFWSHSFNSAIGSWVLLLVYTYAGVTDYLDGVLARKLEVTSNIGRMFDPIADKMLVLAMLMMLIWSDRISGLHILPAIVILLREVLVSGLREYLAGADLSLPVTQLAKWKTAAQMGALGFLAMAAHSPALIPSAMIGELLLWVAAAMTAVTGYHYLMASLRHIGVFGSDDDTTSDETGA